MSSGMPMPSSHPTTPATEDEHWIKDTPSSSFQNPHGLPMPLSKDKEATTPTLEQRHAALPSLEKGSSPLTSEALPPTDEGFAAWSVVAGTAVALFVQFGLGNSFGTFQQYYALHQLSDRSAKDISWIGSVQLFLVFFGGTICGRTFDTHGPRQLIWGGSVVLTLSLLLTSFFHSYHALMICHGVLFGLGSSAIYNPSVAVIGQWFVRRRAAAAGIVVAGAGLGGVVYPIVFSRLFDALGFGWAVRTVALVNAALLLVPCWFMKARLPPKETPTPWIVPLHALREDVAYRWLIGAAFFGFWGLWIPFFYAGDFGVARGMREQLAFYVLPIMNAGSVIGRLIGFVADKWGRFNMLCLSGLFAGVITLSMWLTVTGHAAIFAFAVLYGFGSGAFLSLVPPCSAQLAPPTLIGSRLGFVWFVMSFATLTGPPIAGALLEIGKPGKEYAPMAAFAGVCVMVGGLCAGAARVVLDRRMQAKV